MRTKISEEELNNVNGGMIVFDNDTGKYWVLSDDGDLCYKQPYYDQQSAIECAENLMRVPSLLYTYSTKLYTKKEFVEKFGDAAIFHN